MVTTVEKNGAESDGFWRSEFPVLIAVIVQLVSFWRSCHDEAEPGKTARFRSGRRGRGFTGYVLRSEGLENVTPAARTIWNAAWTFIHLEKFSTRADGVARRCTLKSGQDYTWLDKLDSRQNKAPPPGGGGACSNILPRAVTARLAQSGRRPSCRGRSPRHYCSLVGRGRFPSPVS
jgi:hypothetical protein